MKTIKQYLPVTLFILVLLLAYGFASDSEIEDAEVSAAYTAEIMEQARNDALLARLDEWVNLQFDDQIAQVEP